MRVRLEAAGRDPFWLVGNPYDVKRGNGGGGGALTEAASITREQQVERGGGWLQKMFLDRGNQAFSQDVSDSWIFADAAARLLFMQTLAPMDEADYLHAWEGDFFLREDTNNGEGWLELKLPDGIVAITGLLPDGGVGLRINYRIQGPGLEALDEVNGTGEYAWLKDTDGNPLIDCEDFYLAAAEHDE